MASSRHGIKSTTSGRVISFSQIAASRLCRVILRLNGGFTIASRCTIDANQPYVFIANHQSRIDPFAVFGVLSFADNLRSAPVRFMTAKSIYYSPLRLFLKLCGCYPTKNFDQTVKESVELLGEGYNLFMFPEGRRTPQAESNPRPGVSAIVRSATDAKVPLQLILVHIEWQKKRLGRRHVIISFANATDSLLTENASGIMRAVYAV